MGAVGLTRFVVLIVRNIKALIVMFLILWFLLSLGGSSAAEGLMWAMIMSIFTAPFVIVITPLFRSRKQDKTYMAQTYEDQHYDVNISLGPFATLWKWMSMAYTIKSNIIGFAAVGIGLLVVLNQ